MTNTSSRRRSVLPALVIILVLCGAIAAGLWYWSQNRWYVSTDNAYFTGNMVEVSAQIPGTVVSIAHEINDVVTQDETLVSLSDGDALAALEQSKQALALAVQAVQTQRAEVARLEAQKQRLVVQGRLLTSEYQRRKSLVSNRMVSQEELDAALSANEDNVVALKTADLALAKARLSAGAQPLREHPRVAAAAAALRSAYRHWRKTDVRAPVEGEIARRRVQVGQRVAPGTPLYTIAQRQDAWVEANFKETQLRDMRPGNTVSITSDIYGDDMPLTGEVQSIGTGTGATFALLPPQNATGNWIKVVQRVPVRIRLSDNVDGDKPLPFGASLHVRVDTRTVANTSETPAHKVPLASVNVDAYQEEGVEQMIDNIVAKQSL